MSLDPMLRVVTELARDILGSHQAVAMAAPDHKWSAIRTAVALSPEFHLQGERPVLRDRSCLLSLLSSMRGAVRIPRGQTGTRFRELFATDRPERAGWLAAPLTSRDGRNMGLLHLLEKEEGDFTAEDEAILTQLAQMSSVAIENAINAEAREANRMKDEFLTTLSHELRTPLSAILGWVRLLGSGRLDSDRSAHALEVIERNVLAQTKLIDDLLDVSRVITGKLRLQLKPCTLSDVVMAAIEAMRPAAEGREIQTRFQNLLADGEDRITGDPDRLQQIVWNLISNAIKFTPPRGRVDVTLLSQDGQFEIAVADTGQGMSSDFLTHAFDRFRQADASTTRSQGGLGIGLAIARHLAELHGGSISAESQGPGRGSVFRVHLPAVAVSLKFAAGQLTMSPELQKEILPETTDLSGFTVMVVEDENDSRELISEILRSAGAVVRPVASAAEAMAGIAAALPDVIVSDIGMPVEDGNAMIRRIRLLPPDKGGHTPAVALSAYAREEDRIRSLSAGFQMHLPKPFEPADLTSAILRLATRSIFAALAPWPPNERSSHAATEASGAPAAGGAPRILVIEDDADSREGLRELLQSWGHEVDAADNGPLGIQRALDNRPDLVLIDIGLPGLDGYGVAQRLRAHLSRDDIFLVALTGRVGPEDHAQAIASGFDAYLPKPIDCQRLGSILAARSRASPTTPGT
ncbi:MAG TPA: response regulator [Thermoanaerobaculia bacterium]|nr:response regulator [Thermoanaerobaculia bacterium]